MMDQDRTESLAYLLGGGLGQITRTGMLWLGETGYLYSLGQLLWLVPEINYN